MQKLLIFFTVSIFIFGCATIQPQKTQLEIREFQTRIYESNDMKIVMKSMLNVLQDESFIIKNAVMDLGLLSAEKVVNIKGNKKYYAAIAGTTSLIFLLCRSHEGIFRTIAMISGTMSYISCIMFLYEGGDMKAIVECSGNVSEYDNQIRVRINFQEKILDNKGNIVKVRQIEDAKYYQDFFSKVDKSIFIQKEKL